MYNALVFLFLDVLLLRELRFLTERLAVLDQLLHDVLKTQPETRDA